MQPPPAAETVKEQVVDRVPKKIEELKFGILSKQDIVKQAVLEVSHGGLYVAEGSQEPAEGNHRLTQDSGPYKSPVAGGI
ncbi:hypothetical protein MMC10_002978 [Thelotrema lepadinum]|nr:hypothetical protein [Thelotrema lepadinum]